MNKNTNWTKLLLMAIISFAIMYGLMYAMVDKYDNVYLNWNQFYMAAMMMAAMIIIEMIIMGSMYSNKIKITMISLSAVIFILSMACIRNQVGINDENFLKSMIPHHGGALLMCEKANIEDFEIKELCTSIILGQQMEIDWMKEKLSESK